MIGIVRYDPDHLDHAGRPRPDGEIARRMQEAMLDNGVIAEPRRAGELRAASAPAPHHRAPPGGCGRRHVRKVVAAHPSAVRSVMNGEILEPAPDEPPHAVRHAAVTRTTDLRVATLDAHAPERAHPWTGVAVEALRADIDAIDVCPATGRNLADVINDLSRRVIDHGVSTRLRPGPLRICTPRPLSMRSPPNCSSPPRTSHSTRSIRRRRRRSPRTTSCAGWRRSSDSVPKRRA